MAIMLRKLCEKANYLYGLRIVAGNGGMTNMVQWVHTVEDSEVGDFLHGGELIFSTGIANKNDDWLLPFVRTLIDKNVSGVVLNTGPNITSIPKEVIDYCNEMNFPLMDIPWKTRIVDMSRDFCNQIILNEKKEEDIGQTLRNIVFFPQDTEKYLPVLESNDFDINANYCVIAVMVETNNGDLSYRAEDAIERLLYSVGKHWGFFRVDKVNCYVLNDFTEAETEQFVNGVQNLQNSDRTLETIYVAAGFLNGKIYSLAKNYQITSRLFSVIKKNRISPVYYDKLGIKKLLLAVDDLQILKGFYKDNLMKLKLYDRENGTDYMGFLKMYLKCDGSVQRAAEETFVHRNTINYQLAKVKKVLGNEMKTFEDKLKLIIAFDIEDLI